MSLRFLYLIAPLILLVASHEASAEQRDGFEAKFREFAGQHCVTCHGPDVQKRKLRLDQLPATFDDKDVAKTWAKVADRLARGEMPPKNKPRPPEKDVRAVVDGVRGQLHEASLAKQRRDGRVVL